MSNADWPSRYTYKGRYEEIGITEKVHEFVNKTSKKKLTILDVGCSVGIAINFMQKKLLDDGINSVITGIDVYPSVQNDAEKNLDHFILGDVLKINPTTGFDLIICSRMIYLDTVQRKCSILSKCLEFIKDDGGLITDAENLEYNPTATNIADRKKICYTLLRHGPKAACNEQKIINQLKEKKHTRLIMEKNNIVKYSNEILSSWKKMKFHERYSYLCNIKIKKFLIKLGGQNPDYKKLGRNIIPE